MQNVNFRNLAVMSIWANFKGENDQQVFVIVGEYKQRDYIFNYAYETKERAMEVLANMRREFVLPQSHDLVVQLNWKPWKEGQDVDIRRPTTAKHYWHVFPKG